jgi:hypothetical protein
VQAIAQLDDHHADVLRHGEEHLAQILRLLLLKRLPLNPGELGDAVHQAADFRPELRLYLVQGERRVFRDVVQEAGADSGPIHL